MQNATYKMLLDGEEYTSKCKFLGIFTTRCNSDKFNTENMLIKDKLSQYRCVEIFKQN